MRILVSVLMSAIFVTSKTVESSPLISWYSVPSFSWFYSSNTKDSDVKLNRDIVPGRYLLKHNQYDGLDAVLEAYNLDDDGIAAVREAKIVTSIDVSEEGEVSVATSDAESSEDPNVVTFTPGADNITISNPLNGEMVAFEGSLLGPSILRTKSRGLDTNILEIKTWVFGPTGASVVTEIVIEDEKLKIFAKQFMQRVDENNEPQPLKMKWV